MRASRLISGTSAATAWRPGLPTTSPTKRTLTRVSAGQRVQLVRRRVVRGHLRVAVVKQSVVPIHQGVIRREDGRRQDERRVLRLDRRDLTLEVGELRPLAIDRGALGREACGEGVLLRDARIR